MLLVSCSDSCVRKAKGLFMTSQLNTAVSYRVPTRRRQSPLPGARRDKRRTNGRTRRMVSGYLPEPNTHHHRLKLGAEVGAGAESSIYLLENGCSSTHYALHSVMLAWASPCGWKHRNGVVVVVVVGDLLLLVLARQGKFVAFTRRDI